MSPLGIEIMLHYHVRTDDYRQGDHRAPAVRDHLDFFVHENLLTPLTYGPDGRRFDQPQYAVTERGEAYVLALCSVTLPIAKTITKWETNVGEAK